MISRTISGICLLLLTFSSCEAPWECKQNKIQAELRTQAHSFREVYVYDNVHLVLTEGQSVRVEAPENWLPRIYTKMSSDSVLHIGNDNRCLQAKEYDAPIKVYVGMDNVKKITQEGYGDIRTQNTLQLSHPLDIYSLNVNAQVELTLNVPSLYIYTNLGTAFFIKGDIHSLTVFTQGFGKIDLRQASIANFYTRHNGEGDILVSPRYSADIWIENSGNVKLYSTPTLMKTKITGSGSIIFP
jgi:hypothetical protein